jgi:hypothetical protein
MTRSARSPAPPSARTTCVPTWPPPREWCSTTTATAWTPTTSAARSALQAAAGCGRCHGSPGPRQRATAWTFVRRMHAGSSGAPGLAQRRLPTALAVQARFWCSTVRPLCGEGVARRWLAGPPKAPAALCSWQKDRGRYPVLPGNRCQPLPPAAAGWRPATDSPPPPDAGQICPDLTSQFQCTANSAGKELSCTPTSDLATITDPVRDAAAAKPLCALHQHGLWRQKCRCGKAYAVYLLRRQMRTCQPACLPAACLPARMPRRSVHLSREACSRMPAASMLWECKTQAPAPGMDTCLQTACAVPIACPKALLYSGLVALDNVFELGLAGCWELGLPAQGYIDGLSERHRQQPKLDGRPRWPPGLSSSHNDYNFC